MSRDHINTMQWSQAMGVARQSCARIFRDGGTPNDALSAFGLAPSSAAADWSRTVEMIAEAMCATPLRRAA
jgi:hypothetical protein